MLQIETASFSFERGAIVMLRSPVRYRSRDQDQLSLLFNH